MLGHNAFLFTTGHHCYIMFTDKINITDNIAKAFVKAVCVKKKLSAETVQNIQNSSATISRVKSHITRVKYIHMGNYHRIYNKNLDLRYPLYSKELVFIHY